MHFVVVFRPRTGEIVREEAYDDGRVAQSVFLSLEDSVRGEDDDLQVVMFTAHSMDSVRSTHPHYFRSDEDDEPPTTAEFLVPAH